MLVMGLGLTSGAQGAAMPKELAPVAIGVMQRDAGPAYQVREEKAENAAQGWRLGFSRDGVEVRPKEVKTPWALKLGLARFGSKEALWAYPVVKHEVMGNRVRYDRGAIEEWYVNGPLGLEQGFTVKQAVGPEMVLELDFGWSAQAEGRGVRLAHSGKTLYYGALHAVDAKGRVLPAVLRIVEGRVRLEVATREAAYPVIVDPLLTEEAKLTASDAAEGDEFGRSVALSGDGRTALVGTDNAACPAGGDECGAAYVFMREKGGVWVEQQKLTASDAAPFGDFGRSVVLAADGKTALIGAPGAGPPAAACPAFNCGAGYVFVRHGDSWVEQQKLTGSDAGIGATFGWSVALSADGKTALIGAINIACPTGANACGAGYVFGRRGSQWVEQQKLTASDAAEGDLFGWFVALAADGKTALIGVSFADCPAGDACGAAYVFVRHGGSWVEQQKFTASDAAAGDAFGFSVALSAGGKTALIGPGFRKGGHTQSKFLCFHRDLAR
jgi:hypothetical protein